MADKTTLSAKVPVDTNERVNDLADDLDAKKSDVLRRAVLEYLDEQEDDDEAKGRGRGRSVSPLALVGVVALAIAPTLLATGYTGVGLAAGVVAAAYVLLWVTAYDVLVEEALADARAELADIGGVVGFFRYVANDNAVEDPDTIIERAANLDTVAVGFIVAGVAVLAPAVVLAQLGALESALAAIGVTGALVYFFVIIALMYGGAFLFGLSAVACLAIASTRVDSTTEDAPTTE